MGKLKKQKQVPAGGENKSHFLLNENRQLGDEKTETWKAIFPLSTHIFHSLMCSGLQFK